MYLFKSSPTIIGPVGTGNINQIRRRKDFGSANKKRGKNRSKKSILHKVGAL